MLDNLIENALSYSPDGTSIRIECGRDGQTRPGSRCSTRGRASRPARRPPLFERFARGQRGTRAAAGTGLGLAIVQTLAQRWGGRAALSDPARGRHEGRDPPSGRRRRPDR